MAPYNSSSEIPTDLVEALQVDDPEEALLSLANELHHSAAQLAAELSQSLSGGTSDTNSKTSTKSPSSKRSKSQVMGDGNKVEGDQQQQQQRKFPIPLPKSLLDAPRP